VLKSGPVLLYTRICYYISVDFRKATHNRDMLIALLTMNVKITKFLSFVLYKVKIYGYFL
jgi:hypothetical protein